MSENTNDNIVENIVLTEGSETNKPIKRRNRSTPNKNFPSHNIKESIVIAVKIKELNGGNPWSPKEISNAIGVKPKSNNFYYLTAASRDYGLTIGTRDTEKIELDSIGRGILYATSKEEEFSNIWKAFFNIPLFKNVYDYYNGGTLPELKYLKNTLETTFKIYPEFHDDFYKVYQENLEYIQSFGSNEPSETNNNQQPAVTLAEPSKNSNKSLKAFVIMPFSEKTDKYPNGFFDEVLKSLITPAGIEAGFIVQTARKDGSDIIQATIVNDIDNADIIIVDLTEHNPNVLFELGLTIAFEKPVALIRARGTSQIFDVDNMLRVLDYSANLWKTTLELDIPKLASHLKATWDNRDTYQSYLSILRSKVGRNY